MGPGPLPYGGRSASYGGVRFNSKRACFLYGGRSPHLYVGLGLFERYGGFETVVPAPLSLPPLFFSLLFFIFFFFFFFPFLSLFPFSFSFLILSLLFFS
jgi:hypothetical protein